MINLPSSTKLPIQYLSSVFNRVNNAAKYYWFIAILEEIKENESTHIPIKSLLTRMIANIWYPAYYFKLSFGQHDRLSSIARKINTEKRLPITANKEELMTLVLAHLWRHSPLSKEIMKLGNSVPYNFLLSFYPEEVGNYSDAKAEQVIAKLTHSSFNRETELSLYRFVNVPEPSIEIQTDWFDYLQQHTNILHGFCSWHLLHYLQVNNPNIPNLANKLYEPHHRNVQQATKFWQLVLAKTKSISCIYCGKLIQSSNFELNHFIPWRFMAEDLMWNMVPVSEEVNKNKGDCLPNMELYFEAFVKLQYQAVQAISSQQSRLFEDYIRLFKQDTVSVKSLSFNRFGDILYSAVTPQIQIAKNMGFKADWSYNNH